MGTCLSSTQLGVFHSIVSGFGKVYPFSKYGFGMYGGVFYCFSTSERADERVAH